MNPHKNRELFSSFPVIDKEFDLVFVDAVKFVGDDNEESFVPIIRYVMKNKEDHTIDAGFTLRTGAILESIDVDWNDIIAKSKEFSDYEPKEKQYLH